jgi:hypothetical protein
MIRRGPKRRIKTGVGNLGEGKKTFRVGSRLPIATPEGRMELCRETSAREPGYEGEKASEKMTKMGKKMWEEYLNKGGVV